MCASSSVNISVSVSVCASSSVNISLSVSVCVSSSVNISLSVRINGSVSVFHCEIVCVVVSTTTRLRIMGFED